MSRRSMGRVDTAAISRRWKQKNMEAEQMNVSAVHFGCTGFVGRNVSAVAAHHKMTNILPYRFRAGGMGGVRLQKHVEDGTYGQNFSSDYELDKEFVVKAMLEKVDHVTNSIGMWTEATMTGNSQSWFDMQGVNVEWPRMLARWCREMGINRLVHVSAVGADPNSTCKYLRQKGEAEQAVLDEFPRATIIRGTEMFGQTDWNYSRLLKAQCYLKVVPVPNGGCRMMQPLYVSDFAEACVRALSLDHTEGRIAELGGPVRCTITDILRWCAEVNDLYHLVQPVPYHVMKAMATVNMMNPGKGALIGGRMGAGTWCKEWVDRQYHDNVATPERDPDLLDWEDFGIPREDLLRMEDRYFMVANLFSKSNSYQDYGHLI